MDWPLVIKDLIESGLTQAEIAEKCDTGQSHVSGLLRGERKSPNWALGDALLRLHSQRCPSIERATKGAVRCEDLRPDVDWAYLRGTGEISRAQREEA